MLIARLQSLTINRTFSQLWTASAVSSVGDGMARAAFPLLAALLTRDPALVAGFSFVLALPWLLFSLHAGALIDRLDRKRVLVFASATRTLLLASLSLVIFADALQLGWLYLIAFLYGIVEVVFDNASTTILPSMVERSQLEPANSRLFSVSFIASGFLGPSLGGILFAAFAGLPFLVHGGLLVFTTALVAGLRGVFRNAEPVSARHSLLQDIGGAFAWLRENPLLFNLALTAGAINIAFNAAAAVLVLYALDVLHIGEAGYGLLLSVSAVGGILGALLAGPIKHRLGAGQSILLSVFAFAACHPLMVAGSQPWITAIALSLRAFAIMLWNVNVVSLRQSLVPNRLLGRVNSVYRLVGMGASPIGALLGGLLARQFGLRAPFLAGGLLVTITLVLILPIINNRTVTAAQQKAADNPLN